MSVDKTVTIKNATDKQLDELLFRLRKEFELQGLIMDLQRRSTTQDPFGPYTPTKVSTEAPIESMYHQGILGMKWGVRRKRGPDGTVGGSAHEDHTNAMVLKSKGVKSLSNAELKELNNRLQLEKAYKDLTKQEISPGKKFVQDVILSPAKDSAKELVKKYLTQYAGQGVEQLLKKYGKKAAATAAKAAT